MNTEKREEKKYINEYIEQGGDNITVHYTKCGKIKDNHNDNNKYEHMIFINYGPYQ